MRAVAIVAQDRVRRVAGGFELLGREPGAPRGCSIAIDEIWAYVTAALRNLLDAAVSRPGRECALIVRRSRRRPALARRRGARVHALRRGRRDRRGARVTARHAGTASRVTVILSANVFVAALRAIAIARAAAPEVVVRPSRRDPTRARARLGRGGTRHRHRRELSTSPCSIAARSTSTGATTIADLRAKATIPVRGHGSGMGIAWIFAADLAAAARDLADDVVVFDQRGCLSPRIALVEGDDAYPNSAIYPRGSSKRLEGIVRRGAVPVEERAAAAVTSRR